MKNKPIVTTSSSFDLNSLPSDRKFEELLHRIFQFRVNDDKENEFDTALLMSGVGEKGVDVLLKLKGKNVGAVQCKMNTGGNLNKPSAAKEIIKFILYYIQDNTLIDDINTFQYYFVVSGKFSSTTIKLLSDFKNEILKEPDLTNWTKTVLKKHKAFQSMKYTLIQKSLKRYLSQLIVKPKSYSEINSWLNKYDIIVDEFFEIKKVVDNSTIEKGIKDIQSIINPDIESKVTKFIKEYYKSAKSHLDIVKFIGHDIHLGNKPRNITVSKLYVEPCFRYRESVKTDLENTEKTNFEDDKKLHIHNVFDKNKNYIILGDPGAGKSLLVKNLILRFMKNKVNQGGLKKYKNFIPIRIELRKYNAVKIKRETNIISYLTSLLKNEYQLNAIEEKTIEYMVKNFNTIFFFDGLDEIFDSGQKNIIRDDIINFLAINPKAKCVITSRFRGYHDISFPEKKFCEFEIQHFDDTQVRKFIVKFYSTQISNTIERKREIESCINQLRQVDDNLKSNPLILSLMALLAINRIVIPDSKLEVYRSITNTLVETRDKDEKNLNIKLKVKSKRGTLGYLAYWQYCQMSNQKRINRKLAEKTIADYLINLKSDPIEDIIEAEEAARHFLDYTERRSIYFDDNFTHKTFLEYYTADYIFTKYHNGGKHDERDKIIKKYIETSAWHIVFELLILMINEGLVESDMLDQLIDENLDTSSHENMYFFQSLFKNSIIMSRSIQKRILSETIKLILRENNLITETESAYYEEKDLLLLIQEICRDEDHHDMVQEILLELEDKQVSNQDYIKFYTFIFELRQNVRMKNTTKQYNFSFINNKKLLQLIKEDLLLFVHYHIREIESIEDWIPILSNQAKYFTPESVFNPVSYKYHLHTRKIPLIEIFMMWNNYTSVKKLKRELQQIEKMGISFERIVEHINSNKITLVFWKEKKVEEIIQLLIKSKDKMIDAYLSLLLKSARDGDWMNNCSNIDHPKIKEILSQR